MGICYLLFHVYPEGLALGTVLETEIINKYPKVALKLFFFCPHYFSVPLLPAFQQFLFFALAVVLWLCVSASQIPSNSFSQFFIWLCI